MIIGVTDEDPELVEKWIAARKPTYPIAVLADDAFEDGLGLKAFPSTAIVGPDGSLAYFGFNPEDAAKKALAHAERGPVWPRRFAKVIVEMRSGDLAKSYAELKKNVDGKDLDEKEKSIYDRFATYLEGEASAALSAARQLNTDGEIYRTVKKLRPVADAKPEFAVSAEARDFLREIQAAPDFKAEMQGGEMYAAAKELADEREYVDAVNAYKAVKKKFPESKIGELALKRARTLIDKGLPGFEPSCPRCSKSKRACEKHRQEMKL